VRRPTAFWDASALVPLFIEERASRDARSRLRRFQPVVWWGSVVEVHSAICRLHREHQITDIQKQGALARALLLSQAWREILPADEVRELAIQLLDSYFLKASDGLQLAASLIWCKNKPASREFICGDRRLSEAARSAGFSAIDLTRVSS
jgi:predicted nucleic acid-binding protein